MYTIRCLPSVHRTCSFCVVQVSSSNKKKTELEHDKKKTELEQDKKQKFAYAYKIRNSTVADKHLVT